MSMSEVFASLNDDPNSDIGSDGDPVLISDDSSGASERVGGCAPAIGRADGSDADENGEGDFERVCILRWRTAR
jgi:hypothetical protein